MKTLSLLLCLLAIACSGGRDMTANDADATAPNPTHSAFVDGSVVGEAARFEQVWTPRVNDHAKPIEIIIRDYGDTTGTLIYRNMVAAVPNQGQTGPRWDDSQWTIRLIAALACKTLEQDRRITALEAALASRSQPQP